MGVAAKVGTVITRTLNSFIDTLILITILLVLAFGCYAMWDSRQIHSSASAENYEKYMPAENAFNSFESLQGINPEVFAWLTVYGTNINYPMTQGEDNVKYVNINAEGKYSLSGAIFVDYRNCPNFADFNSIVYGHHMDSDTMFGEISKFSDKANFDSHRYGKVFFDGQERGIEFFAFVQTNENDSRIFKANVTDVEAQQKYLELLKEKAVNIREEVSVTIDDRIILLSTCSPNTTSGRDILVGKLTDDVPFDTFAAEQADSPGIIPAVDGLLNFWEQAALWMKIAILLSATSFIALGIILIVDKRKKCRKTKEVIYNVYKEK